MVAINAGLKVNQENPALDEENRLANCIIPPYCPVFVKRDPEPSDFPMVVANTTHLNDLEWEFFGISFTATTVGDAQTLSVINSTNEKHWPRIAVVVGGSITVPSTTSDIKAGNSIMFSLPRNRDAAVNDLADADVEGIETIKIAVPQKWKLTDQFKKVQGDEATSNSLVITEGDEKHTMVEEDFPLRRAGVCLDVDALKHMRILLK